MRRDTRFWRIVFLIALAHVALLAGFLRWSTAPEVSAESITWLSSDATEGNDSSPQQTEPSPTPLPIPEESPHEKTEHDRLVAPPVKSEIQLPTATPTPRATPRPRPRPTATPKPKPKATPTARSKPKPKPSPTKKSSPKPNATPAQKAKAKTATPKPKAAAKKSGSSSASSPLAKKGGAGSGSKSGGAGGSAKEAGWYGNMLHDRFYKAWEQPKTAVASGVKLSALVRIRIEKDGRVSNFKIVRPSGNVVVDASVQAVGKRVTRVDALPTGIDSGGHYDVNINFELSSDH